LDEDASALLLEILAPARELAADDLGLPPPCHLGYRGLRIEQVVDPNPLFPGWFVYGTEALEGPGLHHRVAGEFVDERLLARDGPIGRAAPAWLVDAMPELLRAARTAPREVREEPEGEAVPCGARAPSKAVDWWNDGYAGGAISRQWNNNCYNFALDARTDTVAQPGRASGFILTPSKVTTRTVRLYAWYDNLYDAPVADNKCLPYAHLVALAVTPPAALAPDYHWWRKNEDGMWSHKAGATEATRLDESGRAITDPRRCDRGRYTQFVGFMCVERGRFRVA
jgi:hypothetical protein